MASSAEQKWSNAKQIEAALRKLLTEGHPTYTEIDHRIHELRLACQDTIFLDFDYAVHESVAGRLWEAHTSINVRYRKLLDRLRKGDQRLVAVERRKLEKHYADFLKTSQYFYKGYIQRLASHFGDMPRLARIADCLYLERLSVQELHYVSHEKSQTLEAACHATLLRLGDLSRYRNMIKTRNRSWDPALGYYNLANDLCPSDPSAHNQMAVVALADQNHLDAVYHLFRAMTAIEPHPLARGNLEIEFKKIISAWKNNNVPKNMNKLDSFVWWFVVLHSKFYHGVEFSAHYELENQVLTDLVTLLKEQSFDDTLHKFVLVSIAAQSTAVTRYSEEAGQVRPETLQSFYFCLGFNIHTMSVLLQNLLAELNNYATGEASLGSAGSLEIPDKFSAKACRIIPALRQYSIWLASSCELILEVAETAETRRRDARILWTLYAEVLTKIAKHVSILKLTRVDYLLEEDAKTEGFSPFRNSDITNFYYGKEKAMKPRFTDFGVQRQDPKLEMESRLYDIIITAIHLTSARKIPLRPGAIDGHFLYNEDYLVSSASDNHDHVFSTPSDLVDPSQFAEQLMRSRSIDCETPDGYGSKRLQASYAVGPVQRSAVSDSNQSMDTDMHRMVDDLLEPHSLSADETSYGMNSLTANEIFAPMGSNGYVNRLQSTPNMLPSLPGLYTNAFTPQANELQPSSPRRPSSGRQLSPLSLSTKEKRLSAAAALDEMTGFSKDPNSIWGRQSSRFIPTQISQSVNQSLQESLNREYMSSGFTNSSSLYPDATQQRFNEAKMARVGQFAVNGNDSTVYPGASDFEKAAMLQSSLWNGSQPWGGYTQTPPGGQG